MTERAVYEKDGTLSEKHVFTRQPGNRVTVIRRYRPDGSEAGTDVGSWNATGCIAKIQRLGTDGRETGSHDFRYDEKGNSTEEVEYGSDGLKVFRTVSTYDPAGNKTEETHYDEAKKSIVLRRRFAYDDRGHPREDSAVVADPAEWRRLAIDEQKMTFTTTFQNESDATGNWVRQIHFAKPPLQAGAPPEANSVIYRTTSY